MGFMKSVGGWIAFGVGLGALGCTSLGPMPASTGVSPVPVARPSFTGQLAVLPGYYLSSVVQEDAKGAAIGQAMLTFEPDRWLRAPGLVLGARSVGNEEAGVYGEPMIGYRAYLDQAERLSLGGVGYGTYANESRRGASYSAARGGAEGAVDFNVTGHSRIAELHVLASASLTALDADGEYCIDANNRYGVDCPEPPDPVGTVVSASAKGLYPGFVGGLALDIGRGIPAVFHGIRLAGYAGGGTMPTVIGAQQESARSYASIGLSIAIGFGAKQ
jgi:hypothetical protein